MKRSLVVLGVGAALFTLISMTPAAADLSDAPPAPLVSGEVVTAHSSSSLNPMWLIVLLLALVAGIGANGAN